MRAGAKDPMLGATETAARTRASSQADRPVIMLDGYSTSTSCALAGSSPVYRARICEPLE